MPTVPTQPSAEPALNGAVPGRRQAVRRPARWWLAGLLVGCLLPAGFAHAENLRHAERIVQVCILAPALIRASSRLQARRRAHVRWPKSGLRLPVERGKKRLPAPSTPQRCTAAHDVLTRRGPPTAWSL